MLRQRQAAPRAARRRLCRCGCGRERAVGYLSPYLPGHRIAAGRFCACGCGAVLGDGYRGYYLPGHRA